MGGRISTADVEAAARRRRKVPNYASQIKKPPLIIRNTPENVRDQTETSPPPIYYDGQHFDGNHGDSLLQYQYGNNGNVDEL
ncbi:hypothetical protein HDV05_000227 [Chytridiales sp. JEL 0842]|nr:hypothetical protein HDV05_000227 [Chytridiales sp. JEL 0842]